MKKSFIFALVAAILAVAPAAAITVDTNIPNVGGTVNFDKNGVNVNGLNSTVNFNQSGVDINSNVNILRDSTGKTLNINLGTGLSSQVSLDAAAKSVVVNLDGNSVTLIKSDNDLVAYNALVVTERPSIKSVETGNGTVVVAYRQPAKFLGLIGTNLGATVTVNAQGDVSVDLPWYSFLFTKRNASKIKTNLETKIAARTNGADVSVFSSGGTSSVRVQAGAKVVNVVTNEIETQVETN